MSTSAYRKLHNNQQLYHIHMVAIPFFYSDKPTNTLALRGVPSSILNDLEVPMMQKLYYKSNKPIITTIISLQSIQKAQQCEQQIKKQMQETNQKYMCKFCKDISQLAGILFQPGKQFVTPPETKQMKEIIDVTAQTVVMNGAQVEYKLKQSGQAMLSFLNEHILSNEHTYYKWRVYSYLQGDGDKKYRNQCFQIIRDGTAWYPPQSPSQNAYPAVLNLKQVKHFEVSLQKMEKRKFAIEELMIFAIHNINFAVHITSIILIHLYETLNSDFIGTFYLISDILFNSTTHTYRDLFQFCLPSIIYRYVLLKQNDDEKLMNEKYLNELKKLFSIWEKKFVFDENFMKGLLFLLELCNADKLYRLRSYPEHQKIREIFGGDMFLFQLEKNCIENGIPFFQHKQQEAKLFLNALFWENDTSANVEPSLGKYDGQPITEKEMLKIQSKGVKVVCCQNLPVSMLFEKNWKSFSSKGNLSQDGA